MGKVTLILAENFRTGLWPLSLRPCPFFVSVHPLLVWRAPDGNCIVGGKS